MVGVRTALLVAALAGGPLGPTSLEAQLGVSRSSVLSLLTEIDVSLGWQEAPLASGERRLMGSQDDPFVVIELMGPPGDLREIVVAFTPSEVALRNLTAIFTVAAVLRTVFPGWADSVEWFNNAMDSGAQQRSTRRRGIEVRMTNYAALTGIVMLAVEAG